MADCPSEDGLLWLRNFHPFLRHCNTCFPLRYPSEKGLEAIKSFSVTPEFDTLMKKVVVT